MSELNLRIWDQLGKTDPAHTKQFQRSGGFKGTAIKPMWCNLRMTEMFGPCGLGWGMEKPSFETHQADKEMLVFCTVGVWYLEKPDSSIRGLVYGVGGDKYLISQQSGLRASDEAFKAAYTDAIGNAMKFIGVAADVHMGKFDDNKYVAEMKDEFTAKAPGAAPAGPKFITKAKAEEMKLIAIGRADKSPDRALYGKEVRKVIQSFGFSAFGEITDDKYQDVVDALEGV
jgi:hypothetical protein